MSAAPSDDIMQEKVEAKAFIDSLMSAEITPIPGSNGMRTMSNTIDFETGRPLRNIVLRNITESFWEACIEALSKPDLRVCAVGSPGIGKTTTTPFLMRMLLERQKTVVYHIPLPKGHGYVYEFIPTSAVGDVKVNVYLESQPLQRIPSLKEPSTYYVVDPGMTQDSCDPPTRIFAKVLIVASPDSKHWGRNEFTKGRGTVAGTFLYFPSWGLDKLLQMRDIMPQQLTEEEVIARFRLFGGVPRHVFASDYEYDQAIAKQNSAANNVDENQVSRMVRSNIADTYSMDSSQPQSALTGYNIANNNFAKGIPVFISDAAADKVSARHISALWRTIVSGENESWKVFESYTRNLMAYGLVQTLQARPCMGKRKRDSTTDGIKIGGCSGIRLAVDVAEACRTQEHLIVYHSVNRFLALIDFMYRDSKGHFHAFQATVGQTHTADVALIKQLERGVGGAKKLTFSYLEPDRKYGDFVTDPVIPRAGRYGTQRNIHHVMIPNPSSEQTKLNPLKAILD